MYITLSNNRKQDSSAHSYVMFQLNDNPISTSGAITLITALLNTSNHALEHLGLQVSQTGSM